MNVRLTKEQKIKVLNSSDIFAVMQQVLLRENKIRRNQEHFWVVGLNNNNKVLFVELVALGANNRVGVDPPEVFRMGIYKLAVKMILVHNHPSGNITPSENDKTFTDRMLKVGKLIGIDILDHLIISETDFTSFKDLGLMDELKASGHFKIVKREEEQLKAWKLQLERDRAVKDNKIEIATKMKADGIDLDTIKKYTGLTKREIGGI